MGTIEEDPRVTHEKWKRKAEDDYKQGMEARAAGKKADAVKFLMRAFVIGRQYRIDSPYPQKAADALEELSKEGMRELDVARDLATGEAPEAGILELRRITRTYLGLPPARLAGSLLRQLEKDPRFQARIREAEFADQLDHARDLEAKAAALAQPAEARQGTDKPDPEPATGESTGAETAVSGGEHGRTRPAGAPASSEPSAEAAGQADLPDGPPLPEGVGALDLDERPLTPAERAARRLELLAEAHAIYARLAETAKGTEVAKKAEAARAALEEDADLMQRIRRARARDQAREWLSLGTNYMRAGRMDRAREFLEKILAECPDTPEAREARGFLNAMKK
jgi:tetratricopeptide (TPR) repeat protein